MLVRPLGDFDDPAGGLGIPSGAQFLGIAQTAFDEGLQGIRQRVPFRVMAQAVINQRIGLDQGLDLFRPGVRPMVQATGGQQPFDMKLVGIGQ